MGWLHFTAYKKRIFDFNYRDTKIHLVIKIVHKAYYRMDTIHVTWSADKYKSHRFEFDFGKRKDEKMNYKVIFSRLRASLAYGLNPQARPVMDRLKGATEDKPNDVHRSIRTSLPV